MKGHKRTLKNLFYCTLLWTFLVPQPLAKAQQSLVQKPTSNAQPAKKAIPRFVSLKKDRVNLRRGPSTTHKVDYVFMRKGLPVEIIAEFDLWRRIRDSEGDEGWVYYSLLSGTRTVLIAPWEEKKTIPLHTSEEKTAKIIAYAETGVLGAVMRCTGKKCLVVLNSEVKGWISQNSLWGVYPNEKF